MRDRGYLAYIEDMVMKNKIQLIELLDKEKG